MQSPDQGQAARCCQTAVRRLQPHGYAAMRASCWAQGPPSATVTSIKVPLLALGGPRRSLATQVMSLAPLDYQKV